MIIAATKKGQITIPTKIRKALHIGKGRKFHVEITNGGGILLRPLTLADELFGIIKSNAPHNLNEKQAWRNARGLEFLHRVKK